MGMGHGLTQKIIRLFVPSANSGRRTMFPPPPKPPPPPSPVARVNFRHRPSRQPNPNPKPTKPNLQTQPGGWLSIVSHSPKNVIAAPLPPPGRSHRLGLPMVVCVWNACLRTSRGMRCVVIRRSSGVAQRACVRVYATRVCWCRRIFTYTYIHTNRNSRSQ